MSRLAVTDLAVRYGRRPVLGPLSARFEAGGCVGIVGPNGAGKTSLVRALMGLVPSTGRILLAGRALAEHPARERARRLAYLPQGHDMHWPLSVRSVVALGRLPHGARDPERLAPQDADAVARALARTGASALAARRIDTLSGGERARVALARALATEAEILVVDEPTAALDPRYRIEMMDRLSETAREGTLVLVVTHDLVQAARVMDRVLVLDAGQLVADGPPGEALSAGRLAEVFGVTSLALGPSEAPIHLPWSPL